MMTVPRNVRWMALALLQMSDAHALTGSVDETFAPVLKRTVPVNYATPAPGGKTLVSGSDYVDGVSTGQMVLLGPDGLPAGEVVPGFIHDPTQAGISAGTFPGWISFSVKNEWVALTPEKWLIPSSNCGWLRWDGSRGVIAFPDLATGESVIPQFVCDGKLWLVRRSANGQQRVEIRSAENGNIDPSFTQSENWPEHPIEAIPGPDGTAWVLGGEPLDRFRYAAGEADRNNRVFRVDETGAFDAAITPQSFLCHREPHLVAGPSGSYRVVLGRDVRSLYYWPVTDFVIHRIEMFDGHGQQQSAKNFQLETFSRMIWAESVTGELLVGGQGGLLNRYLSDGSLDSSFVSPRQAWTVHALADGKWLLNGSRVLSNGSPDPSWHLAQMKSSGRVGIFRPMSGGRVLAGGDFSEVQGSNRNHLVVFLPGGGVDSSFVPDARLSEPVSVAVTDHAIFVVTKLDVIWANGRRSNLVKLNLDGSMDESFFPVMFGNLQVIKRITGVYPQGDGKILLKGTSIGVESSQEKLAFTRVYCGAGCAVTDVSPAMGGIAWIPIFSS